MKYMLVSHNHDEKTMEKITTLFEDAWRRVRQTVPRMLSPAACYLAYCDPTAAWRGLDASTR